MVHLKLTFGDIMQPNILFYDKSTEPACFYICGHLKIDNMPDISGSHFYELKENIFYKEPITNTHSVKITDPIFKDELIQKFEQNRHNVLFVFDEAILVGVVHISDYNRDVVLQCIQDDMLSFERQLRQLILLNGYTNEDMKCHFEKEKLNAKREKEVTYYEQRIQMFVLKKDEIDSHGPFQLFDFSDLILFAQKYVVPPIYQNRNHLIQNIWKSSKDVLVSLRNMAMHGKNPIGRDSETSIYTIKSLESFMERLSAFRKEYSKLAKLIRNHPDFLRSIELENRSRLENISKHSIALQYLLGF